MRHLAFVALLVLGGCSAQGLPLDNGNGTGTGGNGGGSGGGTAVDMAKGGGGDGAKCTTACDCQAGLACRMGTCGAGPIHDLLLRVDGLPERQLLPVVGRLVRPVRHQRRRR